MINFRLPALLALIPLLIGTAMAKDKVDVTTSGAGAFDVTAYVAKQLGYFDELGLDVSIYDGGGGSNAVASLVGGAAQIGIVGIKNASEAMVKGQPLKVVGTAVQGFPNMILVRNDLLAGTNVTVSSPLAAKGALLRNRTIAVNDIGGSSGDLVRYAIAAAGLTEKDITLININTGAGRLAALKAKRIDAVVSTPPEPETGVAGGYGIVLIDPAKDIPALQGMEYMIQAVRADYLAQNRPIVERYLHGIRRAEALIASDPATAKKAFYDFLTTQTHGAKLNADVADLAWTNMQPYFPAKLSLSETGLKTARKFFDISSKAPDEQLVDNQLANQIDIASH